MSNDTSVKSTPKKADNTEKLTKDEKIYQQIYTAIVDHQLAPDTKLPEDALAESFNVSRTIIRKVLLDLSHEGLVTNAPKRGARVSRPSIKEGKEVFEARRIIEVATLPVVIHKINEVSLKLLKDLNNQQLAAQKAQDIKKAIRLSGEFHLELILTSENDSLYDYLRKLISRSSLIVAVFGSTQQHLPSCQGHSKLLELISQNDVEQSQKWMNDHLIDIEASLDFSEPNKTNPDFKKLFSD
ncbi:MAG: GntR family transcriptional regulator [Cocleimonas sp.]